MTAAVAAAIRADAERCSQNPLIDAWDCPYKPGDAFANWARQVWLHAFNGNRKGRAA